MNTDSADAGSDADRRVANSRKSRSGEDADPLSVDCCAPGTPQDSANRARVGVVGFGAQEQHGPHLPLDTDTIIADYFAGLVAKHLGAVTAPTVAVGMSAEHAWSPNTRTLTSMEFRGRVLEAVGQLRRSGATAIVFVNAHGGNRPTLEQVCDDLSHAEVPALCVQPITLVASQFSDGRIPDVHAGLLETSVIAAIAPKLVNWAAAAALDTTRLDDRYVARRIALRGVYWPWSSDDPTIAVEGVLGSPHGASVELGQRIVVEVQRELAEVCEMFQRTTVARSAPEEISRWTS